jgi:hypothetical protein
MFLHWSPSDFWASSPGELFSALAFWKQVNIPETDNEQWAAWAKKTGLIDLV